MTFAVIATIIALAAGVAVAVTLVAIVTWSDRRRAGLPAPLPSFVLAVILALAIVAWAWTAPIWLPGAVYAVGVGWWIVGLIAELRKVRRTSMDVPIAAFGLIGAAFWPVVAIGREVMRRREVRQ